MGDDRLQPGTKIVLVRPDGTTLQASPEQADKLRLLGYQEESPAAAYERDRESARETYYSSGGQQALAAIEGVGRGLTLGATDYLLGDDDTKARSQYNPGTAMAGEIIGSVAPLLVSGGTSSLATAARLTPTAMIARAAGAVTSGVKGRVARAVIGGAVEGGIYGGSQTINHAYLSGDSLTTEAVVAGMGFGAVMGAGLAGVGAKAEGIVAARAEAKAAAAAKAPVKLDGVAGDAYRAFRSEVDGLRTTLTKTAARADTEAASAIKSIADYGRASLPKAELDAVQRELSSALREVRKAQKAGDAVAIDEAVAGYKAAQENALTRIEHGEPQVEWRADPETGRQMAVRATAGPKPTIVDPSATLAELTTMKAVAKELESFPRSVDSFARMSETRAERLFATLEGAKNLKEFPVLAQGADELASKMSAAVGVEGSGISDLRKTWSAAKESLKADKVPAKSNLMARGAGYAAGAFAGAKTTMFTGSKAAGYAAYHTAKGSVTAALSSSSLLGARNQTLSKLTDAAANFVGRAAKGAKVVSSRINPLAVKLDGMMENEHKNDRDLAEMRIREFAEVNQHVNDTLYAAVEPIAGEQPTFAPAMHTTSAKLFSTMRGMLPADPGVVSGLKSIWKPSDIQAAVMRQQYEVFLDPVAASQSMLSSGVISPIKVKALKELYPALFQHLRVALLERVTQPGFLEGMSLNDQIGLGTMLDLPVHSSMRPEFIAASLQLHAKRSEPLPTPAVPGNTNGGRPAGDTPGATAAQITTSR